MIDAAKDAVIQAREPPSDGFEIARITRAIRAYLYRERVTGDQKHDLLAILGYSHTHRKSCNGDECDICKRDLRHNIHNHYEISNEFLKIPRE